MFDACVVHVGIFALKEKLLICFYLNEFSLTAEGFFQLSSVSFGFGLWQKGCELRNDSARTQLTISLAGAESCCGLQGLLI